MVTVNNYKLRSLCADSTKREQATVYVLPAWPQGNHFELLVGKVLLQPFW